MFYSTYFHVFIDLKIDKLMSYKAFNQGECYCDFGCVLVMW